MDAADFQEEYDAVPVPSLLDQLSNDLDIPEGSEVVGGIVFHSIEDELRNGVEDAEMLLDDILYTEGLHLISGHPGAGKTSWVMHMVRMVFEDDILEDRHVVWLDYEGGKKPTIRRLHAVGVPVEQAIERFHYGPWPKDAEKHIADLARRWPGCLVVIDSMSKALSFSGLNENKNDEVLQWTTAMVKQCKDHELPVIVIDHVAKNNSGSSYSRGAGTKLADVDVHWSVNTEHEFNKRQAGVIVVKQKKDREGSMAFETWWNVGDGKGRLVFSRTESPPDPEDADAPDI